MSEYIEVMTHAQRMCEGYQHGHKLPPTKPCSGCPFESSGFDPCPRRIRFADRTPDVLAFIERKVMAWAAEHPIKTMEDILFEKLPNLPRDAYRICPDYIDPTWGSLCDNSVTDRRNACADICRACWRRPVPEKGGADA